MALDYAGRRNQRRSVACNSDLLARATRLARVLRLEHDPQPGQNGRACAPPRFLRVLEAVRRDTPADVRMSLKGVGRLAKAPWRQAIWPQRPAMCPFPRGDRAFKRSPDARTRQIQIRNRQQDLHTAGQAEWQARRRRKLSFSVAATRVNPPDRRQFVTLISG